MRSNAQPPTDPVPFRRLMDVLVIRVDRIVARLVVFSQLLWLRMFQRRAGEPPVYVDVGAAGGFQKKWRMANRLGLVKLVGFEPNEASYKPLCQAHTYAEFLPYALADRDGDFTLNITVDPGCSSCLEPDVKFLERYPIGELFRVVSRVGVSARAFESLVKEKKISPPDFLKLDVQGFEYEVLVGFGDSLDRVIGIELESHTKPLYLGQKAMDEIIRFLAKHHFQLRRFEQQGNFEGECLEANLFFSRDPALLSPQERRRLVLWEILSHVPAPAIYQHRG